MKRIYDATLKATVTLDDAGQVRGINHLDEYREIEQHHGQAAAIAYVRDIAGKLNIAPESLGSLDQPMSYIDPQEKDVEYRFSEKKTFFDSTTYAYYQTYLNTPVWGAGITATVKDDPARVIAATNTSECDIDAKMPSAKDINRYRQLFTIGEKIDGTPPEPKAKRAKVPDSVGSKQLADILGKAAKASKGYDDQQIMPTLIRGRFFVYRYDPAKRTVDHPNPKSEEHQKGSAHDLDQPCCGTPPTLSLPPVPKSIQEGQWYLVAELIIRLPYEGSRMNWRMLVEVNTNTILYLRALSSGVNGCR